MRETPFDSSYESGGGCGDLLLDPEPGAQMGSWERGGAFRAGLIRSSRMTFHLPGQSGAPGSSM